MVFEAVREQINSGELPNRARLASVTELAARFAVSRSTVQEALGLLEAEGLVVRRRGSGVYVISEFADDPAAVGRSTTAERIADEISGSILLGDYPAGMFLPMKKVLQYQFHASPAVIRAALDIVEDRGLVHRKGTTYLAGVKAANNVPADCRVVTVLAPLSQVETMLNWRVSREFIRSFERELNRYGITELRTVDPNTEGPRTLARLSRADTVGFLYLSTCPGLRGPERARLEQHLESASRTGLPVVHFNYNNTLHSYPGLSMRLRDNVYLIVVDNRAGGESIGTYLASLGHTSVAFFGYFSEARWCKERFRGFVRGFKRAAPPGARVAYFRRTPDEKARAVAAPASRRRTKVARSLRSLFESHGFTAVDPADHLMREVSSYLTADNFRKVMAPYFREALARKDITAWACAGEMQAIAALEFLRGRGVRVPEDISLIGINNDEDSVVHALTMYDFQKDRMGYLAAHCFLGDLPLRRGRNGILETPGRIVVRRSTGPRRR